MCTLPLSEDVILRILSGDLSLSFPPESADQATQLQDIVDNFIVNRLPKEFWRSQFYLPSSAVLDSEGSVAKEEVDRGVAKGMELIDQLTSMVNQKNVNLLAYFNQRFSQKRTERFLDSVRSEAKRVVDESYDWG